MPKRLQDIKCPTYKICNKIFTEFHEIIQSSIYKKRKKKAREKSKLPLAKLTADTKEENSIFLSVFRQECVLSHRVLRQTFSWKRDKENSWHKSEQLPRKKATQRLEVPYLAPLCSIMVNKPLRINLISKNYRLTKEECPKSL